jgi:hypothetical protein
MGLGVHAQSVCNACVVVEEADDVDGVKDVMVREAVATEALDVLAGDVRLVAGELNREVEEGAGGGIDGGGAIVLLDLTGEGVIVADRTQILCVGFSSVVATLGSGDDGGDRLSLEAAEAGRRVHQLDVEAGGGPHGPGTEALDSDDVVDVARPFDGGVVLLLEEARRTLVGDGFDPGHGGRSFLAWSVLIARLIVY